MLLLPKYPIILEFDNKELDEYISSKIGNKKLSTKINLLKDLINANNLVNHGELEKIIILFFSRASSVSTSIYDNLNYHKDTAIGIWRTLYEISVIFRTWSQVVTINKDVKLFMVAGERYKDYGIINEYNIFGYLDNKSKNEREVLINKYSEKPKELKLFNEYDWINPVFSKRSLSHMSNKFHPSFRDLVYRTKETDSDLINLLDQYKLSSNVLHMSTLSDTVINSISESELYKMTNIVIRILISDYLLLIENLYNSNDPNVIKIQSISKKLRLNIIKNW